MLFSSRLADASVGLDRDPLLRGSIPIDHRVPDALHDLGEPAGDPIGVLFGQEQ